MNQPTTHSKAMVAVATSYRGYKSPKKIAKNASPVASKPKIHESRTWAWGDLESMLSRAQVKAKEVLQRKIIPVGGKLLKKVANKLLAAAKDGFNQAKSCIAESQTDTVGAVLKPALARKSSLSDEGKKLLSALDKLTKTEKQIKRQTATNTRLNGAVKFSTPIAAPPLSPALELVRAISSEQDNVAAQKIPLTLHHPDSLVVAVPRVSAPVESRSQTPKTRATPQKSLLFGAKDLKSVTLKGVLKSDLSTPKRRVSFGENKFKEISPRPSPTRSEIAEGAKPLALAFNTHDLQNATLKVAADQRPTPTVETVRIEVKPAAPGAIGFSTTDLLGVKLKGVKPKTAEDKIASNISTGVNLHAGITPNTLQAVILKPVRVATQQQAVPRFSNKRSLSLEDQLKSAFAQKFARAKSPEKRDEEEEENEEWL